MIASTAGDGINLFRPNFSPVKEESSSEDDAEIKEVQAEAEEDSAIDK